MIKTILNILKWLLIIGLLATAIIFIGDLLGIINTTLIGAVINNILAFNLPITLLTAYPNFWLLVGYFFTKGLVGFGLNFLKREN